MPPNISDEVEDELIRRRYRRLEIQSNFSDSRFLD